MRALNAWLMPFCIVLPGAMKCQAMPDVWLRAKHNFGRKLRAVIADKKLELAALRDDYGEFLSHALAGDQVSTIAARPLHRDVVGDV